MHLHNKCREQICLSSFDNNTNKHVCFPLPSSKSSGHVTKKQCPLLHYWLMSCMSVLTYVLYVCIDLCPRYHWLMSYMSVLTYILYVGINLCPISLSTYVLYIRNSNVLWLFFFLFVIGFSHSLCREECIWYWDMDAV